MIVKIFKISTREMWTFDNKRDLRQYVMRNAQCIPSKYASIAELVAYLPVEEYYRVKQLKE